MGSEYSFDQDEVWEKCPSADDALAHSRRAFSAARAPTPSSIPHAQAQPGPTVMSGTISSMSYVYDGRECVGFVLARGRKGHEALDREQRSLGLFKTAAAAANVVFNAAASERP
jgi:hypothetical protein